MEFIDKATVEAPYVFSLWGILPIAFLIIVVVTMVILHRNPKIKDSTFKIVETSAIAALAIVIVGSFTIVLKDKVAMYKDINASYNSAIAESINEHYGLKLSPDNISDLKYPITKPSSFEALTFGTLSKDSIENYKTFQKNPTLTLVSVNGTFELFESNEAGDIGRELRKSNH